MKATVYYYSESDKTYHQQGTYNSLKEAKEHYNEDRKGYIKLENDRIAKRYNK